VAGRFNRVFEFHFLLKIEVAVDCPKEVTQGNWGSNAASGAQSCGTTVVRIESFLSDLEATSCHWRMHTRSTTELIKHLGLLRDLLQFLLQLLLYN
jgi:hypothetical protein